MHTVNFMFKSSPTVLTLAYKAFKAADDLYRKARPFDGKIDAEDDYGMTAIIDMAEISAVSFGEIEKMMDKAGQIQIAQHKADLKTQRLAQEDIGLQIAAQAAKGNGSIVRQ